jgi:hypothetical protein
MLGAKEMILIGTEFTATFLPKESWKTSAFDGRGAEERKLIKNTFK